MIDPNGWLVAPQLLPPSARTAATVALDDVFAAEADLAVERSWLTDAYRVAYALPVKHPDLLAVSTHAAVVALARSVLGDDCVLAASNGLDLPPGSVGQPLHRDHPVPTPGVALYLHVVCALDDFAEANGATRVVSGSHLASDDRPPSEYDSAAQAIELAAGDGLAFDGALIHAAGANRTSQPRRALHLFFARPWVQPHWDFPGCFTEEEASALDPEQRRLFGFTGRPRRWDRTAQRVVR